MTVGLAMPELWNVAVDNNVMVELSAQSLVSHSLATAFLS